MSDDGKRGIERLIVGASIGRRARFAQKVRVPVGLEKILFLAARDPELRARLLAERAGTIDAIGVRLRPSERAMLEASPPAALEAMIDKIDASNPRRRRFMGLVAAAATSLAAGTAVVGCDAQPAGIRPDWDAGADAGADAAVDTDTYAGGGALADLAPEDLEKK